ncbi:hypothetical protein [Duganella sp. HH101]|uniref:hypothetical protein n=1 Tax=Duganella sp. HH101 TaxID=1781066 RepID=UPI0008749EA6|nr:hypothetical protein [Duganella sp. HH101]OFA07018.1 hypothetical protein DUGA2_03500 [Duganella sp. HH101]
MACIAPTDHTLFITGPTGTVSYELPQTWQGTIHHPSRAVQQAARIGAWLESHFDPAPGQRFATDFYENFHGIETVL